MPGIWGANLEKVFMSIRNRSLFILLLLISCQSEPTDDPIPYLPFNDIVINLSFPEYTTLRVDGGHKEVNGGIRGIILYRVSESLYMAYERNCSYHPNEACATVNIHSSGLYMIDPCCGSTFSFTDGSPMGGIAWRPLQRYRTDLNGFNLTISDEVIH